jgi:diacylglycerol O-acyltransferase / wax synthase
MPICKSQDRGASGALLVPGFLLLARAGLLRWFANHQRLIHTFVSNLRGPRQPLTLGGMPVRAILAIPATTGNVVVTFCVLSYAGILRITVLSDPSRVPDVAVLTSALCQGLSAIPAACPYEGTFGPQA